MPTLGELAELLGGTVRGPADLEILGVATPEDAGPHQLAFVTDERHVPRLAASRAGAVLVSRAEVAGGRPAIVLADPRAALPKLLAVFAPVPPAEWEGVHPSAIVHPEARVAVGARVGPHAVVAAQAEIAAGASVGALAVVGWGARIGPDSRIEMLAAIAPRTVIGARVLVHAGAVVGADGFGFLPSPAGPIKIPQIGRVVIEDDVEIGANATVDRGTVGDTVIRRGAKLDDQVHVAHNCVIGEGTVVAGQTGFAGSVRVGRGCLIGGQAGFADHVTVGDGVQVGAQSGVHRDAADGERLFGYPARPAAEALKLAAEVARLPRLVARVRELERRIEALEAARVDSKRRRIPSAETKRKSRRGIRKTAA